MAVTSANTTASAAATAPTDTLSPASSTSTLRAATTRSKGQLARRNSFAAAVSSSSKTRHQHQPASPDHPKSHKTRPPRRRRQRQQRQPQPLLGGLFFSDLIVVAFFYALNLLRTCGIAELMDVAFKGATYALTRLPLDFYQRWSLSRFPSSSTVPARDRDPHRKRSHLIPADRVGQLRGPDQDRDSGAQLTQSSAYTTSDEDDCYDEQLSPFHHLVILLVRFACTSFPHLVPRVLFAEETIGPLVRWRTGGGAAGIVREFTDEPRPADSAANSSTFNQARPSSAPSADGTKPAFRAFWIGSDAHTPVEQRRSDDSSRYATTVLYLHGGGFSLGSVAFYAEALIRLMAKVSNVQNRLFGQSGARCIAVEYDLSPSVRFPQPLLQCLRCYAHLIEVERIDPDCITIAGDSAGANLAMSLLLCLDGQARDEPLMAERDWSALPMPGQAILISPWADLRPSASHAFANLRNNASKADPASSASNSSAADGGSHSRGSGKKGSFARASVWTEALTEYEWDYVAAEALLHFAQVYAGLLETPRRVRGPMGWIANVCAILAGEPEDEAKCAKSGLNRYNPLNVISSLASPPKMLARAAHAALTEPLLELGGRNNPLKTSTSSSRKKTTSDAFEDEARIQPLASATGALEPLFPRNERITHAVASTAELYVPTWDLPDEGQDMPKPKKEAIDRLENHVLISPAIGDWGRISLQKGMLVTWGERERLADDIEAWVERVRASRRTNASRDDGSSNTAHPHAGGSGAGAEEPSQDCPVQDARPSDAQIRTIQERREASHAAGGSNANADQRRRHGEWICTVVEHGPAGVHAWPFVSMYLAGTESEREKGLELMARFIARSFQTSEAPASPRMQPLVMDMAAAGQANEPLHPSYTATPRDFLSPAGSMPSDFDPYDQDEHGYQFDVPCVDGSGAWHNELGLQGVESDASSQAHPHDPMWAPTPSTGTGTPVGADAATSSHDNLAERVGLGLASVEAQVPPSESGQRQGMDGLDTGRSSASASTSSSSSSMSTPRVAMEPRFSIKIAEQRPDKSGASHGLSPVHLHHVPAYEYRESTLASRPEAESAVVKSSTGQQATNIARGTIPSMWREDDQGARMGQVPRGKVGRPRTSPPPQTAQLGSVGLTLAEAEALDDDDDKEEGTGAGTLSARSWMQGPGPSTARRGDDPLLRILGARYGGRYAGNSNTEDDDEDDYEDEDDDDEDILAEEMDEEEIVRRGPRGRSGAVDASVNGYVDDEMPMDPGFYGLSHYTTMRPEGLSDITEEDSQLDASSAAGARSPSGFISDDTGSQPSHSPPVSRRPTMSGAFTPSASEMARLKEALEERERQWRARIGSKRAARVYGEDEDVGREEEEAEDEADDEKDDRGLLRPERAMPRSSAGAGAGLSRSSSSSSLGSRKSADVWW